MNVFMGYNPLVAKQVKVSVWVKEIDGAEPILPATPKDGDCFIVFDTDDDVLADNPSSKKAYANGSWGDAGGGGGGGGDIVTITVNMTSETGGTYTSDTSYSEIVSACNNSPYNGKIPIFVTEEDTANFESVYLQGGVPTFKPSPRITAQLLDDGTLTMSRTL